MNTFFFLYAILTYKVFWTVDSYCIVSMRWDPSEQVILYESRALTFFENLSPLGSSVVLYGEFAADRALNSNKRFTITCMQ